MIAMLVRGTLVDLRRECSLVFVVCVVRKIGEGQGECRWGRRVVVGLGM